MNLAPLFDMQSELDKKIRLAHDIPLSQDLTHYIIDALDVEIAELQNEVRYFKFWSKDQEPRTAVLDRCDCPHCPCLEEEMDTTNPCLVEYVDCLHFFLDLGNTFSIPKGFIPMPHKGDNFRRSFRALKRHVYVMDGPMQWYLAFNIFLGIGEMLGFTWTEIEAAYRKKNAVNHERVEAGY